MRSLRSSVALLLAAALLLGLAACGRSAQTADASPAEDQQTPAAEAQTPAVPNTPSSLEKKELVTGQLTLHYWLYTPKNATDAMPLFIYLHGAYARGDDLDALLETEGLPKCLSDGKLGDVPAYILIPQLSLDHYNWMDIEDSLKTLIDTTESACKIDKSRVSLSGHSIGGIGTWDFAVDCPGMFARIAPLSGSVTTDAATLSALKNVSVWAFVGSADTNIPPDSSEALVQALKAQGSDARITVLDGAAHRDVPVLAFGDTTDGLMAWLAFES